MVILIILIKLLKIILLKKRIKQINQNLLKKKDMKIFIRLLLILEFNNFGDCYSYINYGKPSIDEIINKELEKNNIKNI